MEGLGKEDPQGEGRTVGNFAPAVVLEVVRMYPGGPAGDPKGVCTRFAVGEEDRLGVRRSAEVGAQKAGRTAQTAARVVPRRQKRTGSAMKGVVARREERIAQSLAQAVAQREACIRSAELGEVQWEARTCFAAGPAEDQTEAHSCSVDPGEARQEGQTAPTLARAAVREEARIRSAVDLKKTQTAQRNPAAAPAQPCRRDPQSCF